MPKPPEHENFFELKFITNYLLAGCAPPMDLILELSQEPLKDLGALLLIPDPLDIAQEMFAPRHGRRRKPGRHGRKRKWRPRLGDVDGLIGEYFHTTELSEAAMALPGARFAFRLLNFVEGINFGAALAEGVEDVAFETLWGVLEADHNQCLDFDRISRRADYNQIVGFPGPDHYPIGMPTLEFNHNFYNNPFYTAYAPTNWGIGVSARFKNVGEVYGAAGRLILNSSTRGVIAASQHIDLALNSDAMLSVSAVCEPGEDVGWYWAATGGRLECQRPRMLAYGEHGWLDWLL